MGQRWATRLTRPQLDDDVRLLGVVGVELSYPTFAKSAQHMDRNCDSRSGFSGVGKVGNAPTQLDIRGFVGKLRPHRARLSHTLGALSFAGLDAVISRSGNSENTRSSLICMSRWGWSA